jgi:hypothetical protein
LNSDRSWESRQSWRAHSARAHHDHDQHHDGEDRGGGTRLWILVRAGRRPRDADDDGDKATNDAGDDHRRYGKTIQFGTL